MKSKYIGLLIGLVSFNLYSAMPPQFQIATGSDLIHAKDGVDMEPVLVIVNSNEELKTFRYTNNANPYKITLYSYPSPGNSNIDRQLYDKVYTSTLNVNINIAKSQPIPEEVISTYKQKCLNILKSELEKIIKYDTSPQFRLIAKDDELEFCLQPYEGELNPFPVPAKNGILNKYQYTKIYKEVLNINAIKLKKSGLSETAIHSYKTNMLNRLNMINTIHEQQLL